MKVTIFGAGYVGLVTGACLADVGHQVMCIDIDTARIENLKQGIIPIHEPGLDKLVQENIESGLLQFSTSVEDGVAFGSVLFIAVGTPPDEDGAADLQYVLGVAESIGQHMREHRFIVNKSTVPVGTADKVRSRVEAILAKRGLQIGFDVLSNPEFLKEGAAISDFMRPDRIIIGTGSKEAEQAMRELYSPFNRNHERMIVMDVRSAELTKYSANAMLATKISFMNEVANIAERVGADIEQVRRGIGSDSRIGYHFIYAGCGYGGSCFPKDVRALAKMAEEAGYRATLISEVDAVNERQKFHLFELIVKHYGGISNLKGKTFALWGLAFKPNTDDMRGAPSRALMESLWSAGAQVQAYDPVAMNEVQRIYGQRKDLVLAATKEDALSGAAALVICTEWKAFSIPDFDALSTLHERVIFDGRNMYDHHQMKEKGWVYYGIGMGESCHMHSSSRS